MSAKFILAVTLAIAASAIAMSSAHATTGRAAIDRCIDIGVEGGCIYSCSPTTGACKIDMLDTGQTISCPTPDGQCHVERRKAKAARTGAGAVPTVGLNRQ